MKYIIKVLLVLFLLSCSQKKRDVDNNSLVIAEEIASSLHCISDSLISYSSFDFTDTIFVKTSSYDTILSSKSLSQKNLCFWKKIEFYENKNGKQSFFLKNSDYLIRFENKKNIIYCKQVRKPTRLDPHTYDKSITLFTIHRVDSIKNAERSSCFSPSFTR